MIKILFLIHDLGQGGAEKVLVNLVNNLDQSKFDITVMALFGGGVNEQFLKPHIRYISCFKKMVRGNSHLMKLMSPRQLHKWLIKEKYDIEVSYLEGPSARIISGCPSEKAKLVSWIHVEQHSMAALAKSFRSAPEAKHCYEKFHQTVAVSQFVKEDFCRILNYKKPCSVLYNTVESEKIKNWAKDPAPELAADTTFRLVAVGTLKESKGYDRLLRIIKRLRQQGYPIHLYILGIGGLQPELELYCVENGIGNAVSFLGYQTNPYRIVSKCDLFVCASHAEGFSTAATEALIVGTPVCTVDVSGMKEMLGGNNEWGIVTENSEEALYRGIKSLLDYPDRLLYYREKAAQRGAVFSTEDTVKAVQRMLLNLFESAE